MKHIYARRWVTAETAKELQHQAERISDTEWHTYDIQRDAFVAWHVAPADDPRVINRIVEFVGDQP